MSATRQDPVSHDAVFGGAVTVAQHRRGYRFTADALWLVHFALAQARDRVVDLGAGCGVVGLCLARVPAVRALHLVERQHPLAELARRSVALSAPACPTTVHETDLRSLTRAELGGGARLVVSNPPFFAAHSARPARDPEQDHARRELAGELDDFTRAAARLLDADGQLAVVYPARQLDRLIAALAASGLGLRALRPVHARPDLPARLVLALARLGASADCVLLEPWYEQDLAGVETRLAASLRQPQSLQPGGDHQPG